MDRRVGYQSSAVREVAGATLGEGDGQIPVVTPFRCLEARNSSPSNTPPERPEYLPQ